MKKKLVILGLFLFFISFFVGIFYHDLKLESNKKILSSVSDIWLSPDDSQELKVLVIEVNPILYSITDNSLYPNNNGHPKVSEFLRQRSDLSISELSVDIEESSHGYLDVNIVAHEWLNEFPTYNQKKVLLKNGQLAYKYDEETYIEMSRVKGQNYGDWYSMLSTEYFKSIDANNYNFFDYDYIINKYDLINRRKNGEFDQVWLMNISPLGTAETLMVGKNPYWINGPEKSTYVNSNGQTVNIDCENFVIAGFEIARRDSMFHSFGHMTEQIMKRVYGEPHGGIYDENIHNINSKESYNTLNYWEKFTLTDYNNNYNYSGVGNTHFPFNAQYGYDYYHDTKVYTNWREWLNYPNVPGENFVIDDNSAWMNYELNKYIFNDPNACKGEDRIFQRFWFSLMPHISGYTSDGYYNNWWKYWYTLDYVTSVTNNTSNNITVQRRSYVPTDYTVNYYSGDKENIKKVPEGNNVVISNTDVLGFSNGYLYAKKAGTSTVKISYDGHSVSYNVTVEESASEEIDISNLNIRNNIVLLSAKTDLKTILDILNVDDGVKIYDGKVEKGATDIIKTNYVLEVNDTRYSIAILGDVKADGIIDIRDVAKAYDGLANHNYNTYSVAEKEALDMNRDNKKLILDLIKIYINIK